MEASLCPQKTLYSVLSGEFTTHFVKCVGLPASGWLARRFFYPPVVWRNGGSDPVFPVFLLIEDESKADLTLFLFDMSVGDENVSYFKAGFRNSLDDSHYIVTWINNKTFHCRFASEDIAVGLIRTDNYLSEHEKDPCGK